MAEIREIKTDLQSVKSAVIGDEKFGHRGLVARMSNVERVIAILAAFLILIGGERLVKVLF